MYYFCRSSPPPQVTLIPALLVCIYIKTEVSLCQSHKAIHSNEDADGPEPVPAYLLSDIITCLPRMNHPGLFTTTVALIFCPCSICVFTLASLTFKFRHFYKQNCSLGSPSFVFISPCSFSHLTSLHISSFISSMTITVF